MHTLMYHLHYSVVMLVICQAFNNKPDFVCQQKVD